MSPALGSRTFGSAWPRESCIADSHSTTAAPDAGTVVPAGGEHPGAQRLRRGNCLRTQSRKPWLFSDENPHAPSQSTHRHNDDVVGQLHQRGDEGTALIKAQVADERP